MLASALCLFLEVLSAAIPGGTVSLRMPEGWRQLETPETRTLKPQLKADNQVLQRINEEPPANTPLIAIKHDFPGDTIAASAQLFVTPTPKELRGASAIELARGIGAIALKAFHGKYDVPPRETSAAESRAAEWIIRYDLVESSGKTHEMRARSILIVRGDHFYLLGFAAPATDNVDLESFQGIVDSLRFSV